MGFFFCETLALGRMAGKRGYVIVPTVSLAAEIHIPGLISLFDEEPGPAFYKYFATEKKFSFVNGSEIYVKSAEAPERIVGADYAWAWLDEPGTMKREAWRRLMGRMRGSESPLVILTGTPEGMNWVYEEVALPAERGDEGFYAVYGASWDNKKNLPANYFNFLKNLPPALAAAWVEGKFVNMNGLPAYGAFDEAAHLRVSIAFDPRRETSLCVDFNVNPMRWLIAQETDAGTVIPDGCSINLSNSNTYEAAEAAASKLAEFGFNGAVKIYGDASGHARGTNSHETDYAIIQRIVPNCKIAAGRRNPSVRDRVNCLNAAFAENRLLISKSGNEALIRDLRMVCFSDGSGESLDKKSDPDLTHASDALGYYVYARNEAFRRPAASRKY